MFVTVKHKLYACTDIPIRNTNTAKLYVQPPQKSFSFSFSACVEFVVSTILRLFLHPSVHFFLSIYPSFFRSLSLSLSPPVRPSIFSMCSPIRHCLSVSLSISHSLSLYLSLSLILCLTESSSPIN